MKIKKRKENKRFTLIPGNFIFSIPIFSLAVKTFFPSPYFNKVLFGFK